MNSLAPFAQVVFKINNVQTGSTAMLTAGINSLTGNTGWTRFYGQWYSGSTTNVNLSIVNLNTVASGNDFGLDDISFSTLPPVTLSVTARDSVACAQPNFTLPVTQLGGNSPLTYTWTGPNGFTSTAAVPVIANLSSAAAGLYTVKILDGRGCESKLDSATIVVRDTASITTQPAEAIFCPGDASVSYTVAATGYLPTYQWQVSTNNGATYTNLSNAAPYSGVTTATLKITTPLASMNGNLYVCKVNATSCTIANKITDPRRLYLRNTWTGNTSNDAAVASNWSGSALPSLSCSTVYIPGGMPNQPVLSSSTAVINNLVIYPGGILTVNGSGALQVAGTITNNGSFDVSNGTLILNGSASQSIAGNMFVGSTIKNLTIANSNAGGVVLNNTAGNILNLTGTLSFGTVNNSKFVTNDNLVLRSGQTATANVADLTNNGANTGNSILGNVSVERYINTGTGTGQHAKSWQLLTAPTTGQTIKQSWMENGLTPAGYGTIVTGAGGTANGFDINTATPSMKYFNSASNVWVGVSNPISTQLNYQSGYLIFVRGDRSVTTSNGAPVPTILRSKGVLNQNTQPVINIPANNFTVLGNPFASTLDFSKVTKTNIDASFYVWDPTLNGSYNLGGYQTITPLSPTGPYRAVPGNFNTTSNIYNTTDDYRNIQSGEAVFVHATGAGTVQFKENQKATGSALVNRNQSMPSILSTNLLSISGNNVVMADGNLVLFNSAYAAAVDGDDALKIKNDGENFGLIRDNNSLSVEARPEITTADTIYYNMSNLKQQGYKMMFVPENLDESLHAEFVDNFLHTRTAVSLTDTNYINISITADALSKVAGRFMLVFGKVAGPLPVNIVSISANRTNDKSIAVTWKSENETNITRYEVQRSADGKSFSTITNAAPLAVNGGSALYIKTDLTPLSKDNYYRVKAISIGGQVQYSAIVKVAPVKGNASISVYPNPVMDKNVQVHFSGMVAGTYRLQLTNSVGQVIYNGTAEVRGSTFVASVHLDESTAAGTYQLQVIDTEGKMMSSNVIVANN